MKVEVEQRDDGSVLVTPHGRIDTNTSADLDLALRDASDLSDFVTIDFKECAYISSTGLRVLLSLQKRIRDRGELKLTGVSESVIEILEMTGFTDFLTIESLNAVDADIKVLFFDIDGTLLSHSIGKVPESTVRALEAARAKGIKTVIASGRSLEDMQKLPIMDLGFDAYLTLNGNICLDKDLNMFAGNPIDQGEMEIIVSIFKAGRIPFALIGENQRYINYVDDVVIQTQESTHGTIPDIGEYKGEKIYQCLGFVDTATRVKLDNLLDQCHITSWNETGIDIIAETGGKAAGIQKYLDAEGFTRSQSMAFGDGENDIAMLKYVGVGVAMGNASDEVKRAADYVTTSVDEEGIENALKHFNLI